MIIALQTLIFFRESLLTALDRLLRPYYNKFSLTFNRTGSDSDDEEFEDQVFSDYDEEKGVVFYPPMYAQRYAAVSDCLLDERWCGKLEKVVDLGHHDMSFIKYLKEVPGIRTILGVDIESIPLRCSSDLITCDDYIPKRENPLLITLFQGNAADPDYRLIGCDAVIAIEMIEHMMPHDLDRLIHNVFGFIKPWIVIFTTPNGDFNVLFKSLERNGLRRLDHLFEWSREQFNDWCSNIVVRYPLYTVTCKGIGPGPPDTVHLGCCTQMALFVNKDYHKQQDLSLNSLALVANAPSQNNINDVLDNWDVPELLTENNMLCPPSNMESYTEFIFSEKQSRITAIFATPNYSIESIGYEDKTSQCNLDTELGKSFLMFDYDQMYYNILKPSRKLANRVYEIEDVASRLNCTTLQVTKFSKTTQNLMAKNKVDTLVHTREVVDEIRNLTKVLNFNKNTNTNHTNENRPWCNINWGDNAPYWNQYYKVVREYNYPFQVKSDDSRILDLISEEINSLVDSQCEDELTGDFNKMEIPLQYLMRAVRHITDDLDRVKELLEWNGYEIVEDIVIYTRLIDSASVATYEDDWIENDTISDWDTTDFHSTSLSDGSTVVPDYNGRCLRRALDHKLRKLRSMLTADEDISTELDRVVCRLMKLALRTSKGRETPPPTRWMQTKLLDLLTLTEKSIERRKRHFIENYPLMAVEFEKPIKSKDMVNLKKIKEDDTANEIVDKYRYLVHAVEWRDEHAIRLMVSNTTALDGIKTKQHHELQSNAWQSTTIAILRHETLNLNRSNRHYNYEDICRPKYGNIDLELEDDLSEASAEFIKDFECVNRPSPELVNSEVGINENFYKPKYDKGQSILERTQAWIEEDIEVVPYPIHNFDTSGDTDQSTINGIKFKYRKSQKKSKCKKNSIDSGYASHYVSYYDRKCKVRDGERNKKKDKIKSIRVIKKLTQKNSSYSSLLKSSSSKYLAIKISHRTKSKKYRAVSPIENNDVKDFNLNDYQDKPIKYENEYLETSKLNDYTYDNNVLKDIDYNVSATEKSYFIDIITEGKEEETIALRRTIGTDVDSDFMDIETETLINDIRDDYKEFYVKHEVSTENVQSQTIFLNDINEPSTSKGIRHSVSTDVQCGPDDTVPLYSTLSATTSFTKLPKTCRNGIQIGDSCTNINMTSTDFGTCTYDCNVYGTLTPRNRSPGIRIQDSEKNICMTTECSTMTQVLPTETNLVTTDLVSNETTLLKAVSSNIKNEDSSSELCGSVYSFPKTSGPYPNSVNTSDLHIKTSSCKEVEAGDVLSSAQFGKPRLSCGGVHVHAYTEKEVSEDVVFQGQWQKYRPTPHTKRKPCNSFIAKKGIEPILKKRKTNSKEKIPNKTIMHSMPDSKKSVRVYTALNVKPKQEFKKEVKSIHNTFKTVKPVKVASKLNVSSNTTKSPKVTFAKKSVVLPSKLIKTECDSKQKILKNDFIPSYLRKKDITVRTCTKNNLNSSIDSVKTTIKESEKLSLIPHLIRSKTDEIRRDLLKFNITPATKIEYMVFHNEIEKNGSTSKNNQCPTNKSNNLIGSADKKPRSPQSQNSSTCSSPNSIATVRPSTKKVKTLSNKRNSNSSNKFSFNDSGSGTPSPTRPKKFTKRCKSTKRVDESLNNNKENIPANPKKCNANNDKSNKGMFVGSQKSVYIAQLKTENQSLQSGITKSRTQSIKSNIKIPMAETKDEKQRSSSSFKIEKPISDVNFTQRDYSIRELSIPNENNSNVALVLETRKENFINEVIENVPLKSNVANELPSISAHTETTNNTIDKVKSGITLIINQIIDDTLDFIDKTFYDDGTFDSATIILSHEDMNQSYDDCLSLASYKTINTNEDYFESILESDLENALNRTFDSIGEESVINLAETSFTMPDVDLLSFKSVASISKLSEFILDTNELKIDITSNNSFLELFERKEPPINKNIGGVLATQAFSGFSINSEPVVGDQPDHVNFIDSETGSMTLEFARQATSEELFVSGRSSDSYESCLIDEDAVVPNWLFQIISQQQSGTEETQQLQLVEAVPLDMSVPHAEPLYDANGNPVEPGVGAGAGAGDGCGIHSDQSQDSSGRGSSLSSSNTSSDPQSEAIIIDATAFTTQFEILREPIGSTVVIPTLNATTGQFENLLRVEEAQANEPHILRVPPTEGPSRYHTAATSDIDADVSSLDTDVPDSSDN